MHPPPPAATARAACTPPSASSGTCSPSWLVTTSLSFAMVTPGVRSTWGVREEEGRWWWWCGVQEEEEEGLGAEPRRCIECWLRPSKT